MKRKIIPILLVLAVAGAAVWWFLLRPKKEEETILAGSIEARTVEVGSLVGGRVATVHVDEGDRVEAGQPLVTFETDLQDLQIAEQSARIAEARANLERTRIGPRREEVQRARIDYESAEVDRKRFEQLWKQGVVARREYDGAQVKAALALETLREAQRGGRREDIASAEAALAQAERQLSYLERQRQETVVTAPASGVVETMDLRPGDLVGANQPVASLLEENQLWVRVYVPEPQLGQVHPGQPAAVFIDTYPDRAFPGKVVEISNQGEYTPRNLQTLDQRSDQVFGVKVRIDPSPDLKAGMSATVRLDQAGSQPQSKLGSLRR
ncbi:MAG TPA: HlyD family efflux transporter periplasmic adaptor subunit [Thermoanaerobaculia bacterium]|jgi:multidrug resistance efflux pump|nr:HlyD family efflux transporter periplasmic adaptor subunit [Thermoanaerobaculia bacterium]